MITGKKIVLTGANSGIGLETLKLLVQGNNKILAVDLKTDVISTFDQSKVFPMQFARRHPSFCLYCSILPGKVPVKFTQTFALCCGVWYNGKDEDLPLADSVFCFV